MLLQSFGRLINPFYHKPPVPAPSQDRPRTTMRTEYDEALDDIVNYVAESFADTMKFSRAQREHLETLFVDDSGFNNIASSLVSPIDGRLFQAMLHVDGCDFSYFVSIDHEEQDIRFASVQMARNNIVDQIMSQRVQCRTDIASVRDELAAARA